MFWFCNLHIQTMTYLAITGWLFMSIGLSNINKWVFSEEHFSYPLFLTTLHMLSSCIFGSVAIRYTPLGAAFGEGNDRLRMPPKSTLKIFILSVVFTLAIAFGNIALQHLYISFLKMVFALTPLVTVGLSRLCFQRPVDSYVLMSMVPLCCGSMFCITGEVNFSIFGFVAAVAATILRALKSLLQGVLLKEQRIDSIRLLYHMSIPSFIMLLIATAILEPSAIFELNIWAKARLFGFILLSCFCAVGYNIMNFMVTFYTSPIGLQVLGNISIVLDVIVSLVVFQNELSLLSFGGIVGVMIGTMMYQEAGTVKWFVDNRVSRSLNTYF
ncbi:uncharacterized protein [Asterias amurensis]|uniref:uncharacterized protein n=1 Tax=Asterias amurensis TaxID=7602 RepID=UPI003AB4624D